MKPKLTKASLARARRWRSLPRWWIQRRRHILQCLCQCEDLDAAADDLVSGRGPSKERLDNIGATIQDRIRIPFPGGALRVELSAFPPIALVPTYIATTLIAGRWQIFVHLATLGYVLKRSVDAVQSVEAARTAFFTSWTVTSVLLFYAMWTFSLTGGLPENPLHPVSLLNHVPFLVCLGSVAAIRGARIPRASEMIKRGSGAPSVAPGSQRKRDCPVCGEAPPRSKHCRISGTCVDRYDHFCVWVGRAIGAHNRRPFVLFLVAILICTYRFCAAVTARQGRPFTISLLCEVFLLQHPGNSLNTSLLVYASIAAIAIAGLLAQQIYAISTNITTYERANSRKRDYIRVHPGTSTLVSDFDLGFRDNWREFLRGTLQKS